MYINTHNYDFYLVYVSQWNNSKFHQRQRKKETTTHRHKQHLVGEGKEREVEEGKGGQIYGDARRTDGGGVNT